MRKPRESDLRLQRNRSNATLRRRLVLKARRRAEAVYVHAASIAKKNGAERKADLSMGLAKTR